MAPVQRRTDWMREIGGSVRLLRLLLLLVAALALSAAGPTDRVTGEAPAIPGKATVLDGDTLEIGGRRYDIRGIDAPELDQTCMKDGMPWLCGVAAAFELKKIIELSDVVCSPNGERGKVVLVSCFSGSRDVAEMLLSAGEVVAEEEGAPGYARIEARARATGLGLWRGTWVPPRDWRQGKRGPDGEAPLQTACMIKGVREQGEAVFLVPTDEGYAERKVSRADGETLFCTIEEAEAHGWHRRRPSSN